jgi:hypothetical protein
MHLTRSLYMITVTVLPMLVHAQLVDHRAEMPASIEDNSFFVEEAYNQEPGVVQHIFGGLFYRHPATSTTLAFTQEWPLFSQKHQLSFTVGYSTYGASVWSGFADSFIHYRYQALDDDGWAACAPRLSLILPTGNVDKGLGYGVVGWQANIPFSKRVSEKCIVHFNVGATLFPGVKGTTREGESVTHSLPSYNIAGSAIWLVHPNFNLMLETVALLVSELDDNADVAHSQEFIISPGVRGAINLGELQIVPGLAAPLGMIDGESRLGFLLYLSLEHPF